ncbi:TNF receptor-associated factor 6-like [Xenia sp. Carnegie-2017]|uniref:TNF receptor-associated factor 6-like n=1 Tax=Xenia sp. Carnegie-2017 TaxID=2897299 RepID=UPI001F04B401|nr:TNF receptor-associated factor 6-like [Xenia sp. Carnegie-2017]
MPGIKIHDEDREKIHSRYFCGYCNLLVVNPIQTSSCGHLFCQACFDILLGGPDPKCPEDQEKLSKKNAFPDNFIKRELKSIRLHCPSEKCKWFGAYEELEGHSQVCEHALTSCIHKQCNIQLPRSLLDEHLKNECEYRNVKCEYCGKDVPYASLMDHKENVCENAFVTCKYCNQMIPRKDIEHHESTICDEVPTDCEFQAIGCRHDKTLERREIRQHMNDNVIDHMSLLLRYVQRPQFTTAAQNLGDRITAVRSNPSEKFVMLAGKLTGLERRIESQERRIESQERRIESQEMRIESQEMRIESQERSIESRERRIESQERRIESQERRIESQERSIESQERMIESQERRIESQERSIDSLERRIENLENRGEENRIASLERQATAISTISQRMWESLDERGDLPEEPHNAREL